MPFSLLLQLMGFINSCSWPTGSPDICQWKCRQDFNGTSGETVWTRESFVPMLWCGIRWENQRSHPFFDSLTHPQASKHISFMPELQNLASFFSICFLRCFSERWTCFTTMRHHERDRVALTSDSFWHYPPAPVSAIRGSCLALEHMSRPVLTGTGLPSGLCHLSWSSPRVRQRTALLLFPKTKQYVTFSSWILLLSWVSKRWISQASVWQTKFLSPDSVWLLTGSCHVKPVLSSNLVPFRAAICENTTCWRYTHTYRER